MLATLERIEILDKANEISQMILQSDAVEYYHKCIYNVRTNKDTQRKIRAFVKMKEHYEDVQRFGTHHPDYKKVMKDIRVLKREMDMDENIAEFRRAENDLQSLLDEVSVLVGHAVSEQIKVPTGDPFFENSSGCGSGGSCGCS